MAVQRHGASFDTTGGFKQQYGARNAPSVAMRAGTASGKPPSSKALVRQYWP